MAMVSYLKYMKKHKLNDEKIRVPSDTKLFRGSHTPKKKLLKNILIIF